MRTQLALLVSLCLSFAWISWLASESTAKEPADAVVSVVSLDQEGNPWRQGMGILVSKEGRVLTSASIMADCRSGIVKTADGALHVIQKVIRWDSLQDLALLQIEPVSSRIRPVEPAQRLQSPEKVWRGVREKTGALLREAELTKTLPFSPRLILLKLEPGNLEAEPGSPVLNRRGELLGMLHTFAGGQEKSKGYQFYLACELAQSPSRNGGKREELRWPEEPLKNPGSPRIQAFWEGVGSSVRQQWKEAHEKFTLSLAQPEGLAEAYYGRGVASYHLGDGDGAAKDLEEATRRLPGYALAFLWLGKARERQGKSRGASQAFEQATKFAPDLSEAWFRLGELAYKGGDLVKAKECLERTKGDATQGAQSWWYLGNIALKEDRKEDGLEAFKQATLTEPNFFQAYLDGGRLLLEDLGRPQEAVVWLKEGVGLKPQQGLPRYYLSLAYLMAWNPGAAWEQYFKLQEMAPDLAASLAPTLERSR